MLRPVVGTRFQVLFHSPPGVLFTFPSRYFFTIGHHIVFSLGRWSSLLPTRFLVSRGTLDTSQPSYFSRTGLLPSMVSAFQPLILLNSWNHYASPQPQTTLGSLVWAIPLSLATTYGITFVFSSYGYLDVSVPHVSLLNTIYSC